MPPFILDLLLGLGAIGLAMLGQADVSGLLPDLLGKLGPVGLCVWLVVHYTVVTIPRMEQRHMDERQKMLDMFDKALQQKRADYKAELEQQRSDFREELEMQRADFAKMLALEQK